MIIIKVTVLVLLLIGGCAAKLGVDLSVPTNVSTWSCIQKEGDVSFGIVRVYRSVGDVDQNAPQTIKDAFSSGLKDLSGYIFPCIGSASYAKENDISCDSPEDQMRRTVAFLEESGINILRKSYSTEASGKNMHPSVTEPDNDLPLRAPLLKMLYLDIEDEQPSKYFDEDPAINQDFIGAMVNEAERLEVVIGFYTTMTYWDTIMGNTESFSAYPLWYPRWDGENSMDFFEPFAGWEKVTVKQTAGDAPLCGVSQVDLDYREDLV